MKRYMFVFLLLTLFLGTTIVMISSHWFTIWMGLELSTLSILPLLSTNFISRSKEAVLKYFLVQAFSATLLLKGVVLKLWATKSWNMTFTKSIMPHSIMTVALMIKLGLAPCHFWFPDVLSGVSFMEGLIMACWQKIAPFSMVLSSNSTMMTEIILVSSVISVIMGGWGGLNQTSMRKILAYSSMAHLGWMLATKFYSQNASMALFMMYLFLNTLMFLMCHSINIKSISFLKKMNLSFTKIMLFLMAILSLGGLPPLGGFMKKLLPLMMFKSKSKMLLSMPFLMGSLMSLFFYLRMTFNASLMLFPQHSMNLIKWQTLNTTKSLFTSMLFPFSLLGLLLFPIFMVML